MWIAIAAALLLAAMLTAVGLRGRRADDHPLCRRCRFDLTGRPDTAERRCPECGADLRGPSAITVGHRRRRPLPLGIGVAVLVPVGLVTALVAVGAATGVNWLAHAPVAYLLWQGASSSPARGAQAVDELAARLADGRLRGAAGWDRVTAVGLAFQADPSKPWDPAWGDLLEAAHAAGHLTASQWSAYLAAAPVGVLQRVRPRARVRRGDPFPYALDLRPGRVGRNSGLTVGVQRLRLQFDDRPAAPSARDDWGSYPLAHVTGSQTLTCQPADLPAPLSPGTHTLRVSAELVVGSGYNARGLLGTPAGTVDLTAPFTLLPADRSSVRVVHDPAAGVAVRRAMAVGLIRSAGDALRIDLDASPVGLGFDVFARADGHETKLTSFATPAWSTAGSRGWWMGLSGPVLPATAAADVILRSSPAAAAATVDTFDVWDGELVFPDVPIR